MRGGSIDELAQAFARTVGPALEPDASAVRTYRAARARLEDAVGRLHPSR